MKYTPTAVSGDLIDFRAMTDYGSSSSLYATGMRTVNGYKTAPIPYLPDKAVGGNPYYPAARANPSSAHGSFRIVGQWTP